MSDKITFSERAAAVAPSKLGLDPGDQISLADAIKAIVTKSANDVAVALAEKIVGSEANFARLMNARARELGMTGTHYENASGLPNDDQITTARDMAILALHLQDDFPQYYPFFSTRIFSYAGKSYRNHNTMLNSFAGVDGIKTGYTRASGFNLVTSWHRGNRHLIGVVFGGNTAGQRNAEMRSLLTRMVSRASPVVTRRPMLLARLKAEPKIAQRPTKPLSRPKVVEASVAAEPPETPIHIFKVKAVPIAARPGHSTPSADDTTDMDDTGLASAPAVPPARQVQPIRAFAPTNLAEARKPTRYVTGALPPPPPAPVQAKRRQVAPVAVASANDMHEPRVIRGLPPSTLGAQARALDGSRQTFQPPPVRTPANRGRYAVQIGAYGSIDDAQRALSNVQDRAGRLLAGASSVTNPTMKDGHQIYRARFTGFDAGRATSTCNALRRQSVDCFVMAGD